MTVIAPGIRFLDLRFQGLAAGRRDGRPRGRRPRRARSIPARPARSTCCASSSRSAASSLGDVEAILLTHIHLDHAGACGTILREHPGITVYVHERGAPHLINPEKLLTSATRLYGSAMDRLWGAFEPVPAGQHPGSGGW